MWRINFELLLLLFQSNRNGYVINSATLKREAVLEPRNHHLQHVTALFWTLWVSTLSTRGHQNCTDTVGVLGFVSLAFGQEGLAFPPPAICSKISCRNCSVQCWCPQTLSSVVALLSGSMWCREVGSVMTSPDLLADSYRDNDDYCFTRVYGFNLNKNECRNITHAATSARCHVGGFPSIKGRFHVYFKTSVMC